MPPYKIIGTVSAIFVLAVLLASVVWIYISQLETTETEEVETTETEEVSTDSILHEISQQSPFLRDEVYFADEGVLVSGAALHALHELYLEDARRIVEFEFTLVPDILNQATVPPPSDTNVADLEAYQAVQSGDEPPPAAAQELVPPTYERTYIEIVEDTPYGERIGDMRFEIGILVATFAHMYDRPALHERLPGVNQTADPIPLPLDPTARTVYPNLRASEAYFYDELFSRIDPEQAESYSEYAELHAAYGQYHGLYGQSDVAATAALVRQYFDLYEEIHGPLSEQFSELAVLLRNMRSS